MRSFENDESPNDAERHPQEHKREVRAACIGCVLCVLCCDVGGWPGRRDVDGVHRRPGDCRGVTVSRLASPCTRVRTASTQPCMWTQKRIVHRFLGSPAMRSGARCGRCRRSYDDDSSTPPAKTDSGVGPILTESAPNDPDSLRQGCRCLT